MIDDAPKLSIGRLDRILRFSRSANILCSPSLAKPPVCEAGSEKKGTEALSNESLHRGRIPDRSYHQTQQLAFHMVSMLVGLVGLADVKSTLNQSPKKIVKLHTI
jgi:hypothetical protein